MTYDGWQAMMFGIRSNKQNGDSGSVDLCAGYHIELLKQAFFMNYVYWGRLVENLVCVVSIENDCYSIFLINCWRSIPCMIHLADQDSMSCLY